MKSCTWMKRRIEDDGVRFNGSSVIGAECSITWKPELSIGFRMGQCIIVFCKGKLHLSSKRELSDNDDDSNIFSLKIIEFVASLTQAIPPRVPIPRAYSMLP